MTLEELKKLCREDAEGLDAFSAVVSDDWTGQLFTVARRQNDLIAKLLEVVERASRALDERKGWTVAGRDVPDSPAVNALRQSLSALNLSD